AGKWLENRTRASLAGQIAEAIHAGRRPAHYSHSADDDHAVNIAMEVCGSAEQCSAWLKWLFVATRDHLSLQHVWPAVEALAAELMRRETISEFLRGGTRCFRGLLCGDLYPLRRFKLAVEVLQPLLRIVSPLAQFVFGLSLS